MAVQVGRLKAPNLAALSEKERQDLRLDEDAERILEQVLHRRRWATADRDALAEEIRNIAEREIRLRLRTPGKSA